MNRYEFRDKAYKLLLENIEQYPVLKNAFYYVAKGDYQDGIYRCNEETLLLADVINFGFDWGATHEGPDYWMEFHRRINTEMRIYDLPVGAMGMTTNYLIKIKRVAIPLPTIALNKPTDRLFITDGGKLLVISKDNDSLCHKVDDALFIIKT